MTSQIIPVDPFDYVIFGATGDLSMRKIFPAFFHRYLDGQIPPGCRFIGASRTEESSDDFRQAVKEALEKFIQQADYDASQMDSFLTLIHYCSVDAKSDRGWADLKRLLGDNAQDIRAFYLAVAPQLFGDMCKRIGDAGLVTPSCRVVVEKPIGKDLASAQVINRQLQAVFQESQIYRIDHYLGKETVQNLMALRFANSLFEPLWNSAHIDHVQITVAESLGVEGRAGYYDRSGAMRDMIQNHLLQLLCFVAMEPPESSAANSVRDEKLKVLKALKTIDETNFESLTVRGQYRAGASVSGPVSGYLEELGDDTSDTETFVAIKAEIANWRWAGVPFYLRTGKRLAARVSELQVVFKHIPHSIFEASAGQIASNRLSIRLQPDEGVKLWIMIKDPGPGGMRLAHLPLDMSFAQSFKARNPDAYERLLLDVVRGNQTLFVRGDEVEAAWTWVDPILAAWQANPQLPKGYTSGTWGPSAAVALIERDQRTWHDDID